VILVEKRERTIREAIDTLVGIAKTRWLEKWSRWINELLSNYDIEDPADVLGFHDIYDLDKIQSFLKGLCSDLIESECLNQIEKMIREKGFKKKINEEIGESISDYLKSIEQRPEVLYGFPASIRAEVDRFRMRPELDGNKAYDLIYNFLVSEGVDPEEARKIADEIKKTIPKVPVSKRPDVIETSIIIGKISKQRVLDDYAKKQSKATKIVERAKKSLNERVIYVLIEDMNLRVVFPTINDLKAELIRQDYDISGLEDIILSLKASDMIIEENNKLYVRRYYRRGIKLPEVSLIVPREEKRVEEKKEEYVEEYEREKYTPTVPPVTPPAISPFIPFPQKYIFTTKEFPAFIKNLTDTGYTLVARIEMCIEWVGKIDDWLIYLFSDSVVSIRQISLDIFNVMLGSGIHYFIGIKGGYIYAYRCAR